MNLLLEYLVTVNTYRRFKKKRKIKVNEKSFMLFCMIGFIVLIIKMFGEYLVEAWIK